MSVFFINKLLNRNTANYLMMLLIIFIFYFIFNHIFQLTKLSINYNLNYDYGSYLKKMCGMEYFESETPRYQFAKNIDNLLIKDNYKEYLTFLLVVTIIISLIISLLFSYIVYNTFINEEWFYEIIEKNIDTKFDEYIKTHSSYGSLKNYWYMFLYCLKIIYNIILSPIANLWLIPKNLWNNKDHKYGTSIIMRIIFGFIIFLSYIIVFAIITLMPLYIGLNLGGVIDMSPFNVKPEAYAPYIALFSLIFIFRFFYWVFKKDESDSSSWNPIKEYYANNLDKLYINNDVSGYIVFFAAMAVYICMFYILGNIINIWKNYDIEKDKKTKENDININIKENLYNVYLNKIFGYNEYANFDVPFVFVKNISGITSTLFIIIIVMLCLLYITSLFTSNINNDSVLKYGIIVPLITLVLVIFLPNSIYEYNNFINKYILDIPVNIYKKYLNLIHIFFNDKIVLPEYKNDMTESSNGYICRNIGNRILLVLYSNLFNGIDKIQKSDIKSSFSFNLTPEFIYDDKCDDNLPYNFSKNKEYEIDYYINNKGLKKNIFYNFTKCSDINTKIIKLFIDNFHILNNINFENIQDENRNNIQSNNIIKIIIEKIYDKLYGPNKIISEDPLKYVKNILESDIFSDKEASENVKIEIKTQIDNFRNKIKNQLIFSLITENDKTFSGKNNLIYFKNSDSKFYQKNSIVNLNILEIHNINNKLEQVPDNTGNVTKYDNLLNEISNLYTDIVYTMLYSITPLYYKWLNEYKNIYNNNFKKFINDDKNLNTETFNNWIDLNMKSISFNRSNILTDFNNYIKNKNDANKKILLDNFSNEINISKSKFNKTEIINDFLKEEYKLQHEMFIDKITTNIKDIFKKINDKLSSYSFKNKPYMLSNYIINNYNSINNENIYTKNKFDIITQTDSINDKDVYKSVKDYKKYLDNLIKIQNDLVIIISMIEDNKYKTNEFIVKFNELKQNINKQYTNFENFIKDEKIKNNINDSINVKNTNYTLIYYNIRDSDSSTTDTSSNTNNNIKKIVETININNNICDITLNMFKLFLSTKDMIEMIINGYYKYVDYINKNISILLTNIDYLIIDYKKYDDVAKYIIFEDKFNINIPGFSKDLSFNTIKDSCDVDKIVYLVIINYIIAVILANVIII